MNSWKSSTLLVLAAFTVSVLLLFAKSSMIGERTVHDEVMVSNYIYSPAAADPDLRSQDRAERIRLSRGKARKVSTKTRSSKPWTKAPRTPTAPAEATSVKPSVRRSSATPENEFYVVTATFSSYENANRGLEQMKALGMDKAFVGNFDEGKFYSVIGQTFPKEASARFMVSELLKKHGIKAYVYHKQD